MDDTIKVTRQAGVMHITFARETRMNAIDAAMTRRLTTMFEALPGDKQIRAVLITGRGRNFSAGGDMGDIAAMTGGDARTRAATMQHAVTTLSKPLTLALARVPQPVIAAVRGHAIGVALQIVLMADLVVASDTARFSLPQLTLGHTPDHGESWALPRKVGLGRALQMALLAQRIDAETAEHYGLVNIRVADADLDTRALALAETIAAAPPVAAQGAKALFNGAQGLALDQAMDAEIAMMGQVAAQDDFVEAITAFAEKRPPVFGGH
jgi:2-(1,2-epoxy-1,2-dihydrophenyl)acetyl-CoA isomerase